MTAFFTGLGSASDRTLFTYKGPIVKKSIQLTGGANLSIVGPDIVSIPTNPFQYNHVGKQLVISGTPSGRNDGTFFISKVISNSVVKLENASFSWINEQETIDSLLLLTNELQSKYNNHRASLSHVNPDTFNPSSSGLAVDLASINIMLNGLRNAFSSHIVTVFNGPVPVHIEPDQENQVQAIESYNLPSAILLANDLRRRFELHRQDDIIHLSRDLTSRIQNPEVVPVVGSGPLVGPFSWIIQDPRIGQIADDPLDVEVRVNGLPVPIDSVFGLLGAIVLTNAPVHGDTVVVDYDYLANPPTSFERLNTPEFVLNGSAIGSTVGLPGHSYRARSHLLDPSTYSGTVGSAYQPLQVGWKYKGLERAYTAVLNDPNTLLLNVPGNRVAYPVFEATVKEVTIRYDPTTLPNESTDPWELEGSGDISLAPGGNQLTIIDDNVQSGPSSNPPFYTYPLDLGFPSTVSAAFRLSAEVIQNSGAVVGPGFGFTDGSTIAFVGLLETNANNLSSAISRANLLKEKFDLHIATTGVHRPNSYQDTIDVVSATDEVSLIILSNRLKYFFNQHISHGSSGDGVVHIINDIVNVYSDADADDVESSIFLLNELTIKFNSHRTQSGIHYIDDEINIVGFVKQIGILVEAKFPEFESSWTSSAFDWSISTVFRLYKDAEGTVSLYSGGDFSPLASLEAVSLPAAADVDLKLDPVQQTFFGSISRQASSISNWNYVRVNVTPLNFDQVIDNKSVVYEPIDVPEKDPFAPWIAIGQGGYDRAISGKLLVDSTSSVSPSVVSSSGLSTGEYRGFLRLEPILQRTTTSSIEFTVSIGYYTYSVDNRATGVFLDDGDLSVHLVFLQGIPVPASVTGILSEPFPIVTNDTAILSIDGALPQTITFTAPVTGAANVAFTINSQVSFPIASVVNGRIVLTNKSFGSSSSIQIIGGHVFEKLGIQIGFYFGRDSSPEPKVSWFGGDYPDLDTTPWIPAGSQSANLLGRILRISDSNSLDYRTYSFVDPLYLNVIMRGASDWKFDFRCAVLSFTPGDQISVGTNLSPCGVIVNMDEGTTGKNIELQLSQDSIGQKYINVLSYNFNTVSFVSVSEIPFAWDDGNPHSYNVYTSKSANLCIILADNVAVGTFAYSALQAGVAGPAISFGSGSEPVANADIRSSHSVVDWSSVCIFKDSKISDPQAESLRFIGLYKGGDPSSLRSYYLHQIDWTQTHTYRIVRDPASFVSIYVDGALIPSISVNYNVLTLPPVESSFLKEITNARNSIAFGSFNPFEINRTCWGTISYSIGKITLTDRRIVGHQVLNYGNAVASPDHLFTKLGHKQFGFNVWSGGTPLDTFLSEGNEAYTILGDGTPPVPMTQDLESRGGLVKVDIPTALIPSEDFVNSPGFISDLEDDSANVLTVIPFVKQLIDLVNEAIEKFNRHLTAYGLAGNITVDVHVGPDIVNFITYMPAVDLSTSIALLNTLSSAYTAHLTEAGVHTVNDVVNTPVLGPSSDAETAYLAAVELIQLMNNHFNLGPLTPSLVHNIEDLQDIITGPIQDPIDNSRDFSIDIKKKYNAHLTQYRVHLNNDTKNFMLLPDPPVSPPSPIQDLIDGTAAILESIKKVYNTHRTMTVGDSGSRVHTVHDVTNVITAPVYVPLDSFDIIVNLCFDEWVNYSAHLINSGSHGSSVFIRLDPPDRVLYEGMKFFTQTDGELGLVAPFSDDETLYMGGVSLTGPHSVGLSGSALPEQAQLVGVFQEPFTIIGNGSLLLTIDGVETNVQFQLTDTSVALVLLRINTEFMSPVCFDVGDGRIVVASPTVGSGSSVSASGDGARSIGLEVPGMTPWVLKNGNDLNVSVGLVAVGPTTALRYESNNTDTVYRTATGLPDSPSFNFEVSVSVRINQWSTDVNGDTGIYAGIGGSVGNGFTVGIGFDEIAGQKWVKLQNLSEIDIPGGFPYGKTIYRILFDWGDSNFHEYKIVRDVSQDTMVLVIVS